MAVLDTLAVMGTDALANHYSIILPDTITQLSGITDQLVYRITNVSIPEKTINTYSITKRGRTFDRPNGNNEQNREVSFSFRPDKKLLTYKAMINWMNYIQDNVTGFMASDSGSEGVVGPSTYRANLEIWAIDRLSDNNLAGTPNTIWRLVGAFPTSVGGLEFDDTNGEPFQVEVTLNCFNIIYPSV